MENIPIDCYACSNQETCEHRDFFVKVTQAINLDRVPVSCENFDPVKQEVDTICFNGEY